MLNSNKESIKVLYEDNHLIIVNKQCGDIVQGDKTGDKTLAEKVKDYIKEKYNKPGAVFLGVTHRLDRPTSGVVIFARTTKALTRLNKMFKEHSIQKTYLAIVDKMPPSTTNRITHYLVRNTKQNKSYASLKEKKDSKKAELTYKFIAKSDKYFLLSIDLHTGRHHQIRAQLNAINCIIKGDLKYGSPRSNKNGGIDLHAHSVQFIHPVKKVNISVVAPFPNTNIWLYFSKII